MSKVKIIDKFLDNKLFMLLFSLVAAFLFWFFIVANVSPESTRTIYGVPVTVDDSSGIVSSTSLHVIENSTAKVNVEVRGPRYLIGRLGPSDFVITPDLGPVVKSGTYHLQLSKSLKKPNSEIKILKLSNPNIEIYFDTIISKILNVEIRMQNNSRVAEGYIMQTATVNPKQVTVTGPSEKVTGIAHAYVDLKIGGYADTTVSMKNPVSFYDAKNSAIDSGHLKVDYSNVSVTVPILKTKTVPLTVDFSNIPAGFDKSNITVTVNPPSITVAGKAQDIDDLTSIKLSSIDFMSLDVSSTVNQQLVLPKGFTSVDNISSAAVGVTMQNTASATVSTKTISVANAPTGYTIKVRTTQIGGIKLFGPSSQVNAATQVAATIDMSKINVIEGTYEVPVTITVPGKTGFWVTGNYVANVTVWKNY